MVDILPLKMFVDRVLNLDRLASCGFPSRCHEVSLSITNFIKFTGEFLILFKICDFRGSDYEESRLMGYKTLVRTSQETHYVSALESSQLMLCKILGFHGSDYEECRLLGYKTLVRTSQGTHYFSVTELRRSMLCKIWVVHTVTMKNAVFWDVRPCGSCKNRRSGGTYHLHHQGNKNRQFRNNFSSY
jgi:hypothetical protein